MAAPSRASEREPRHLREVLQYELRKIVLHFNEGPRCRFVAVLLRLAFINFAFLLSSACLIGRGRPNHGDGVQRVAGGGRRHGCCCWITFSYEPKISS